MRIYSQAKRCWTLCMASLSSEADICYLTNKQKVGYSLLWFQKILQVKEDNTLFRIFSSRCFLNHRTEPQSAPGLMEPPFFFLKSKYSAKPDRYWQGIQDFLLCFVQELDSALPGLSEWQGKAGSSSSDYAQNVALRCQEAVVRLQPR